AAFGQAAAAVLADVVIGGNAILGGAADDDRFVEDVVGDEIADLAQFLLAAGDLPDLAPQLRILGAGIAFRDIGLDADHGRALGDRPLGLADLVQRASPAWKTTLGEGAARHLLADAMGLAGASTWVDARSRGLKA